MAARALQSTFMLPQLLQRVPYMALQTLGAQRLPRFALNLPLLSPTTFLPAIAISIPSLVSDIWESVLRAVPKKKTSHMKKRHRQMAGKALKDAIDVNTCSGCGQPKRAHKLCPTCVSAHLTDIYSLAVTPSQILSSSGESSLKVHSTGEADFPIAQSIDKAHKIGCHHVVTSESGIRAASAGFGGEVKVWQYESGMWIEDVKVNQTGNVSGVWAIALSSDSQYLAGTTYDGHIKVWDLLNGVTQIRDLETKGSYGMCIDLSSDGKLTASGHQNGSIYVFDNETSRMPYSLSGLVEPVRAVSFSPGGKLLAAAGDSKVIVLYETSSGEQVATLSGHTAWITSLDWSHTGELLLSGSLDGKVKVWSIERKACVATHSESEKAIWSVKWLRKVGKTEGFATAGANRSIAIYREATGG
ncbi:ribosomal protein L32 [Polytolypa hystricis UAMH7299]|uniref:Ribosomal protein L32 n=1 Tax=Polytolypa hystricis (strain UAMH7299) TaxID=1447883 RepID=A0A2B7XA29_POLH7|nr:ribosomal protein L32 [Polytolypa hystricis UAMH7299]